MEGSGQSTISGSVGILENYLLHVGGGEGGEQEAMQVRGRGSNHGRDAGCDAPHMYGYCTLV